jgi:hypothetical protein
MSVGVVVCGYWGQEHLRVLPGLLKNVERIVAIDERPDGLADLTPLPSPVPRRSLLEALPLLGVVP